MTQGLVGKIGYVAAVMITGILSAMSFMHGGFVALPADLDFGICLPSPNTWYASQPGGAWCLSMLCWITASLLLIFLNKKVNLTRSPALTLAIVLILALGAIPWLTSTLFSGPLMALCVVGVIRILFGQVGKRKNAAPVFLAFTLPAIGSMLNYAFLLMLPAFFAVMVLLRLVSPKTLVAAIMGVVSPYITVAGLGIVSLSSFRVPEVRWIWSVDLLPEYTLTAYIAVGVMTLLLLILSLSNAMLLFSAKKHIRYFNASLNTLAAVAAIWMVADIDNFFTYVSVILVALAVAMAHATAKLQTGPASVRMVLFAICCIGLFCMENFLTL